MKKQGGRHDKVKHGLLKGSAALFQQTECVVRYILFLRYILAGLIDRASGVKDGGTPLKCGGESRAFEGEHRHIGDG